MTPPSAKGRLSTAVTNLNKAYYYIAGLIVSPTTIQLPKFKNPTPTKEKLNHAIDATNTVIRDFHDAKFDSMIANAVSGNYAPKPSGTDILKAVTPGFSRYAVQVLKTPLGVTSVALLCGAAFMTNAQARENLSKAFKETTTVTVQATDKIGKKVAEGIPPAIPISAITNPMFKKVEVKPL